MTVQLGRELLDPLLALFKERSFLRKKVILSSGRESDFYINTKPSALWPRGMVLLGEALFAACREIDHEGKIRGVGGLTLGADPLAYALSFTSALRGHPYPAFIVRKESKSHGTQAWIEGEENLPKGSELLVVEDVITTGRSALTAVERVRMSGYTVTAVLAAVDRQEGGREAIELQGLSVYSLFTRKDFIPS